MMHLLLITPVTDVAVRPCFFQDDLFRGPAKGENKEQLVPAVTLQQPADIRCE